METIVNDHKNLRKLGIYFLAETLVLSVLLYYFRDLFVAPMAAWLLPLLVLSMLLCSIFFVFMSRSEELLDAEGVTARSVFRTKTYLWADVRKFEIHWEWRQTKFWAIKKEKIPYIRLVFSNPKREFRFPYREDIDACIRRFYGAPDRDTWTEETNK